MNSIVKKTKHALLQCEISQPVNFRNVRNFAGCEFYSATPLHQKFDKNCKRNKKNCRKLKIKLKTKIN